jgi:hypothetical protein
MKYLKWDVLKISIKIFNQQGGHLIFIFVFFR